MTLRWTSTPPTVEGFYFYLGTCGQITVVQVRCNPYGCPNDPSECFLAHFIGDDTTFFAHDWPGDWAGPLTPPPASPNAFLFEDLVLSEPYDLPRQPNEGG